jgi:hypothetical protein
MLAPLNITPNIYFYEIAILCTYMIYTASCVMLLVRAASLRGQVGGSWALDIETFLGPLKLHRADRRMPFGAQKSQGPYHAFSAVK